MRNSEDVGKRLAVNMLVKLDSDKKLFHIMEHNFQQ